MANTIRRDGSYEGSRDSRVNGNESAKLNEHLHALRSITKGFYQNDLQEKRINSRHGEFNNVRNGEISSRQGKGGQNRGSGENLQQAEITCILFIRYKA